MGLEPTPGPWQGPVLPLYYGRPNQRNSNTTAFLRQDPTRSLTGPVYCMQRASRRAARSDFFRSFFKKWDQPTCTTRAVFTTGDFRCRSANFVAFSRSV